MIIGGDTGVFKAEIREQASTKRPTNAGVDRLRTFEYGIQQAITEGRTLDQLSMRAGDLVVVPERSAGFGGPESLVRTIGVLLSIPLSIVGLIAIF